MLTFLLQKNPRVLFCPPPTTHSVSRLMLPICELIFSTGTTWRRENSHGGLWYEFSNFCKTLHGVLVSCTTPLVLLQQALREPDVNIRTYAGTLKVVIALWSCQDSLAWMYLSFPVQVWVSEIMLQQTQVATVMDYYIKWMKVHILISVWRYHQFVDVVKLCECVPALAHGFGSCRCDTGGDHYHLRSQSKNT